jgi:protein-L-isoaspartate(D-aspartate) O-methyltransferase
MVSEQLVDRGIGDERVLEAMLQVPREEFVPPDLRDYAYADSPLPIGSGQTISQPFTVAYMLQALHLNGTDSVLEIGTGSGYAAAVLSCLAENVHTVERVPDLADKAKQRLERLGYSNVEVHLANGTLGLPKFAPFHAIVVTAGALHLPETYCDQLADAGRIVIPLGEPTSQSLYRFTKQGRRIAREDLGGFAFVPLIGRYGWSDQDAKTGWRIHSANLP